MLSKVTFSIKPLLIYLIEILVKVLSKESSYTLKLGLVSMAISLLLPQIMYCELIITQCGNITIMKIRLALAVNKKIYTEINGQAMLLLHLVKSNIW